MTPEEWLLRLDERLDRLEAAANRTAVTQERHHAVLEEHIRRTQLAEEAVALLREEVDPIKAHVAAFAVVGKILGAAGTVVGLVLGLLKLAGLL